LQLGDLLAQFEDEAVAAEALIALGDVALMVGVATAAADQHLTLGEFAAEAVQRFATHAGDEDWMSMIGAMARTDDPGRVLLRRALAAALSKIPSPTQQNNSSLNALFTQGGR
jgi:hypothetical protein